MSEEKQEQISHVSPQWHSILWGNVKEYFVRASQTIYGDNLSRLEQDNSFWKPQKKPTAIVTGANTGIGFETARYLALHGWDVVAGCRSEPKGKDAVAKIQKALDEQEEKKGGKISLELVDLADLSSIEKFAQRYKASKRPLHVLVNNAGLVLVNKRSETKDGFESTMGVCHIGTFHLTEQLISVLKASKPAKVVNVASLAHTMANWNTDDMLYEERPYNGGPQYGNAKLANILHAIEGEKRYGKDGVHFYSVHPGSVATDFYRSFPGGVVRDAILATLLKSAASGARTQIYLTLAPTEELIGGEYYADTVLGYPRTELSRSEAAASELWKWTVKQIKSKGH
eukprot:Clim_evm78s22 gene=Clim_evmTU78s22